MAPTVAILWGWKQDIFILSFEFCGIKGQRELTEYVCLADIPEMLLNDSYDWRGRKETTVCATEADSYAGITIQLLKKRDLK